MFLTCLIGFVAVIALSSALKPLGVFPFLMFGFAYCGAIAVLDWLCLSFSPEFLFILSVLYLVLYIILWVTKLRINPLWILAILFALAMVRYCCGGDSLIQSFVYSICMSVILIGLATFVNISCEEFCKCWDIEMPAKAAADRRCPNCGSSRVSESSCFGASYDTIIKGYCCKRCGKTWEDKI